MRREGGGSADCKLAFLVEEAPGGGYQARALGHSIFTEADSLAELKEAVRDAVGCRFKDHKDRLRRGRGRRAVKLPGWPDCWAGTGTALCDRHGHT